LGNFNYASFIWSVADKLRGPYGRADYGKVILPFAVLRRLDCTLEATKSKVLELAKDKSLDGVTKDVMLQAAAGYKFYNTSPYDLKTAIGDPSQLRQNIVSYVNGFSPNIRDVFEKYEFNNVSLRGCFDMDKCVHKITFLLYLTNKYILLDGGFCNLKI
jgi:type I restriction enzyme M protein